MRNLVIRCNSKGEFMVILVISEENEVVRHELIPALEMAFPQIVSLLLVINPKLNDIINDLPFECLKGEPYLIETMKSPRPGYDELKFRIGPVSFFQTNVYQAERLYKTAFDLADVQGDELMYDLYTGTGTIAQYFSRFVNKVVGIEYVQAGLHRQQWPSRLHRHRPAPCGHGREGGGTAAEDPRQEDRLCQLQPRHAGPRPAVA